MIRGFFETVKVDCNFDRNSYFREVGSFVSKLAAQFENVFETWSQFMYYDY